jgi:diguanylate cyclase (GGDEF)-like protein
MDATQELAEFVAAVSDAETEELALREGVRRAAQAVGADVAAVVRDGSIAAAAGAPLEDAAVEELLGAASRREGRVRMPGAGVLRSIVCDLGDEAGACLLLARTGEPGFDAVETGLLRGMARTLALSLRTLRSVAVLRERQRLLEGLSEIQRAISRRAPLHDVLEMVVGLTHALMPGELPALFLRDPDDPGMLVLEACRGLDNATIETIRRRHVGQGVAGRAVAEDRLVVVEDYPAAMAAPVHENGAVVGSLQVSTWRQGRRYTSDERELLQSIAQHVSLALTDAKRVGAMVHQALHDALTGLPNRALFLDRLQHALARAFRAGNGVAVLFLDLDRFKTVNDSLGHAAGDELLCAVAKRLSACMRAADTAARLGGDEFAVVLEDLRSTREAVRVAERIIAAFAEPFEVSGRAVFVGASIGVATGTHGAQDLLRHADVAMYRAKADGKGRYAMFEAGMEAEVMDTRRCVRRS